MDRKNDLHNNFYRRQQLYKQIQDGNVKEFNFDILREPIWTKVEVNKTRNLEKNEHYKNV